ncbi:MAG: hypothetical protein ACR2KV_04215 [Solirubrobacteraceae bacterium]
MTPADGTPVDDEIRRLLGAQRMRGDFAAIHVAPSCAEEVPDVAGARLVVVGPDHPHTEAGASAALVHAAAVLGGEERVYRNMLVFLAADAARLEELRAAVGAGGDVRELLGETWRWLLVPPAAGADWGTSRATGRDDLAMRASRQLRADGDLFAEYPPARLRADLDRVPLWPEGAHHVALADVWEAYARSVELPRLRSSAVLAAAVAAGVGLPGWERDGFAYAESWDVEAGRFEGLAADRQGDLVLRGTGLLVRPEAAAAQLAAES